MVELNGVERSSLLRGVAVVLVRPRNMLNIGAVARAMVDFGFDDLRVVTDYPLPLQEARSAVDAASVLAAARLYGSVAEAVADRRLVYGTTALGARNLIHPVDLLREASARVHARTAALAADGTTEGSAVALLFGSEKTGLSNEELSHCDRLLTIPMHTQGVSMNLGQAVAVTLYELMREAEAPRLLPEPVVAATAAELGRYEALLWQCLEAAGYEERHPGRLTGENLRRLVRRLQLPADDLPAWLGMLRQLVWKLGGAKGSAEG